MHLTTNALVLREVNYKESDKILTLLTEEEGKLTVSARGCRKKDSPIAGRIRNLCREIGDTVYLVEHPDLSGELLALKVQSGALRYAVVNERVAAPLTLRFSNLDAGSPISFTQFQCVVTADADSALLHRFDTWLEKASSSPEAAELRARYGLSVPRR